MQPPLCTAQTVSTYRRGSARHISSFSPSHQSVGLTGNCLIVPTYFYLEVQRRLVPGLEGSAALNVLVVML